MPDMVIAMPGIISLFFLILFEAVEPCFCSSYGRSPAYIISSLSDLEFPWATSAVALIKGIPDTLGI
ncbi:hypothetical protein SISNIDRAFT_492085 [Sistotremastrum niveocremeum HHB9708]|uniref:Uncharacterized protein n=1 Tax=Sistotremastrum niveocremeum HHB9708 TaxID=1314777 RepID=A0A164M334_9AGAM|nr:hypothetical protein SISNIDRAFT_492085 [Sistotremastrum niveocremeum HHB9708]